MQRNTPSSLLTASAKAGWPKAEGRVAPKRQHSAALPCTPQHRSAASNNREQDEHPHLHHAPENGGVVGALLARAICLWARQSKAAGDEECWPAVEVWCGHRKTSACGFCSASRPSQTAPTHQPGLTHPPARPHPPSNQPTFQIGSSASCTNSGLARPCWSPWGQGQKVMQLMFSPPTQRLTWPLIGKTTPTTPNGYSSAP